MPCARSCCRSPGRCCSTPRRSTPPRASTSGTSPRRSPTWPSSRRCRCSSLWNRRGAAAASPPDRSGHGAGTSGKVWPAPCFGWSAWARIGCMTFLAGQRQIRVTAWSFAGFTVLVLVAAMVLLGLNARAVSAPRIGVYAFVGAGCLVYAGIGGLLASRVPRNVIGWLLGLTGFWVAANLFLEQYGLRGLATAPGSLPAVRTVAALGQSATNLIFATLILVVLLFPTGRLPSKRWRPAGWAAVWVLVVGGVAQTLQRGTVIQGGLTDALQTAHVAYPNPLGVFPRQGWYSGLSAVTAVVAGACALLTIVSVFWRRRGAAAELRQQL